MKAWNSPQSAGLGPPAKGMENYLRGGVSVTTVVGILDSLTPAYGTMGL